MKYLIFSILVFLQLQSLAQTSCFAGLTGIGDSISINGNMYISGNLILGAGTYITDINVTNDTVNFVSVDSTFKLQTLGNLEITASGDSIGIAGGGNKLGTDDIGTKELFITIYGSGSSVPTGDGTDGLPIPFSFNGMNLVDVIATTYAKGITGTTNIMVRRSRGGTDVDMLSSPVTIGDEFYALDGTINVSNDDVQTGDMIFIDIDAVHSGTAPLGLSVALEFRKP